MIFGGNLGIKPHYRWRYDLQAWEQRGFWAHRPWLLFPATGVFVMNKPEKGTDEL